MRILVERRKVNMAESWKEAEIKNGQKNHRKQNM